MVDMVEGMEEVVVVLRRALLVHGLLLNSIVFLDWSNTMLLKLKANWLSFLIFDGISISLGTSAIYSLLWGRIKQGAYDSPNVWLIIILSYMAPVIFHFCIVPFCYFFIDEKGLGATGNIGFYKWPFFKGLTYYKEWSNMYEIDYADSPIWNGLFIDSDKRGFYINFYLLTNKKKAIRILLEKLPRDKATIAAEEKFFLKWENKFHKEEYVFE